MDIQLSVPEEELIAEANVFAAREAAGRLAAWEADGRIPQATFKAAAEIGLTRIQVPADFGGLDFGYATKMRVAEEIAKTSMALAFTLINTQNVAAKLAVDAPHDVARHYIPDLIACDAFGATALTEPHTGSDFANIATRAEKTGDGWLLNGTKAWITNAAIANLFVTYAQTDPTLGWRGVACFLVDASAPGFRRSAPERLIGGNAIGTGGFELTDYFVPDAHQIHPAGEAFKKAMQSINGARTYVAAMCCGMLHHALSLASNYAGQRTAFGQPLLANQGLRWTLADIATDLEAARLLTYKAARLVQDESPDAVLAAAHAKKFAARIAQTHLPHCIQAMGANGLLERHGLGQHLACAKIAHYVDGTTEIQNERIAALLFDSGR